MIHDSQLIDILFYSPLDIEKVLVCLQKAEECMQTTSSFNGKVAPHILTVYSDFIYLDF